MNDFKHSEHVSVSRQQAAERLTDIAYALVAGPPLVLRIDGEELRVPLPDDLVLAWESRAADGRVELELAISWPAN